MRAPLAASALCLLLLLSAPAQGATFAALTGAGVGTKSVGACTTTAGLVVHLDLVSGDGSLAFPSNLLFASSCGGFTNAFVKDCARAAGGISCTGSNPVDASFTLADDGTAVYEAAYGATTFRATASIAYHVLVVP